METEVGTQTARGNTLRTETETYKEKPLHTKTRNCGKLYDSDSPSLTHSLMELSPS
jgi:hypothetical protein